jgi:hypothetical protein
MKVIGRRMEMKIRPTMKRVTNGEKFIIGWRTRRVMAHKVCTLDDVQSVFRIPSVLASMPTQE